MRFGISLRRRLTNLTSSPHLLELKNMKTYFSGSGGLLSRNKQQVKAVDGVSFHLKKGETLGIVGESGCGKSTMGRTIIQLEKATDGLISFEGEEINQYKGKQLRGIRQDMQMIFQDPFGSLNPRITVGSMLTEIIKVHKVVPADQSKSYILKLLDDVGLQPDHFWRYPHEFSGGQRQRVSIARALAVKPKLIICDEAVSALDVSVQAQVLNLLKRLKSEYELTYLFISHDLSVVKHISDRVAVMYLGTIVELASKDQLYNKPRHPYTEALFSAIPEVTINKKKRILLKGDIPSPLNIPSGCRFHTRCPMATDYCKAEQPELREIEPGHFSACHYS
ncbi:ABC transporter ATP-binding protein [Alkalicoccobacillus porphyridii]|uniref:Dipeptide ABC transporter ATP-binding protein n=1 Tax=Alkalicoccobacillus porphyridii TaxID=2597270 RepID=A0A553ZWE9_9BACI|nr:dipeptide ABC transporter ATP-binding protein [Alkalicoccobacillus porphyridii]